MRRAALVVALRLLARTPVSASSVLGASGSHLADVGQREGLALLVDGIDKDVNLCRQSAPVNITEGVVRYLFAEYVSGRDDKEQADPRQATPTAGNGTTFKHEIGVAGHGVHPCVVGGDFVQVELGFAKKSDRGSYTTVALQHAADQSEDHEDLDTTGRGLTRITDCEADRKLANALGPAKEHILYAEVGADLGLTETFGTNTADDGESESNNGNHRASDGQPNLHPCRYFLPFSGCSTSLSSISGAHLGVQIGSLMFIGIALAFLCVGGLFWVLYNNHWKLPAMTNAAFYFGGLVFFYG